LYDHEYEKYKQYFDIAGAAKMFALMVPEMIEGGSMRFSTSEFAKLYTEREGLLAEL